MVDTAVIMAAGIGSRFGKMTESIPKGFVEIFGKPMIIRSIETLLACGINKIIIGTGFCKEIYESLTITYPNILCCYNQKFERTNSLWTLCNCQNLIGNRDFILLESDLIFEKRAILELIANSHENILLASDEIKFQDQYFIEYDSKGYLVNCSTNKNELIVCGEFVGINKLSSNFYKQLCRYYNNIKNELPKLGYEFGLLFISKNNIPLYVLNIHNLKWYEIDDENDLKFAQEHLCLE